MEGVVTKLCLARGFGFIAPKRGPDVFFHVHDCDVNLPWDDQLLRRSVRFEVIHGAKGESAKNVRPV
jgi:cold shock CspA family protein